MREFRPPVRPSKLRWVLLALVVVAGLAPTAALGGVLLSISTISYAIGGGVLTVRAGDLFTGERKVPLADIVEARAVNLTRGRRTAGTAMAGYCAGRFTYEDIGPVWQASSCGSRAVLIRVKDQERPILVTPPDREDFLARLKSGDAMAITLPPPDKGALGVLGLVMIPSGLIVSGMVGALLVLGPSRMRYLVGGGALEVHTLFGKKRWQTAGARAREHKPGRIWRVAGTGMPGYFTGIFREDGQTTRMYATSHEGMVLFEEGDQRVLLSPEDREGFLKALEGEGASITR